MMSMMATSSARSACSGPASAGLRYEWRSRSRGGSSIRSSAPAVAEARRACHSPKVVSTAGRGGGRAEEMSDAAAWRPA